MVEIVIAVAEKVSEYLAAPIGRQLGYLFRYRSYTDDLRNKVETLMKERADLEITIDAAKSRRGDEIRPIVEDWLKQVDEITEEAEVILMKKQNQNCLGGWCANLKSRYQLGREAYKKAQVIDGIQTARNFPDGVSYHVPPRSVTFKDYECFESRESTLRKIMDALRDDEMKMIGVWGMGGVGKTTLLKQVAELAKQEKLFATQVYVEVSWTREATGDKFQQGISDIQQHIADKLGVEFKNEARSTKADKLRQRLQKEKILIILDDLWKEINLGEVGIPFSCIDDNDGDQKYECKIAFASRYEQLLSKDMGAQKCFPIQHLPPKEAWDLFKKTAGDSVEGDELRPVAMEVVKECQGLPVAIVTIAKALKDESVTVWKNALGELKNSTPINIRGVEEKVYSCMELSYKHLKGDELKSLFLLCGCLSYGDISMAELLRYAMGVEAFDHLKSLEEARNKLVASVRTLKASSLLLEGEDDRAHGYFGRGPSRLLFMDADDNKTIRMHDVVRDVARNIAAKDPSRRFVVREVVGLEDHWSETDESKSCTLVSLYCNGLNDQLPQRLVCPELKFFLLQINRRPLNIPDTFFEGMNRLKVLDLSQTHLRSLPSTLKSLANLQTLCLDWCSKLQDIVGIGGLKKLQVLSMIGSSIQQLPKEMERLTNLRLLDLNNCNQLTVIPRNIFSRLSQLECLFMKSSFSQWAAEEEVRDGESDIACLSELNHLHHLKMIEIAISDVKSVPKEDDFFQNLTTYAIFIGTCFFPYEKSKTLYLREADGSLLLRKGISKLLKKTEELTLGNLNEACCGSISVGLFDSLTTLKVEKCGGLKFLFLLSTAGGLSKLEEMTIEKCNAMLQVVTFEREFEIMEDDHVGINFQQFPKLRSFKLSSLPNLVNFGNFSSELEITTSQGMCSQGINLHVDMPFFSNQILFSKLEILELCKLPKLKEIWHHQLPLDSFSNLQMLRVEDCPCLLNLIPCHLMQSFKNLKGIIVKNCEVLRHVFDLQGYDDTNVNCCGKEDKEKANDNGVGFGEKVSSSNLEELKLNSPSMLKTTQHPHKLQILNVYTCPHLVDLIPSQLLESFQNLEEVVVYNCKVLEHVFDDRGLIGNDHKILPKIKFLRLEELPKVRHIFLEDNKDNNLLPPIKFKDFHHLKELYIINCGKLLHEKISVSSSLEVLVLECFNKLKEIDFGIMPKLKTLRLKALPKLRRSFFSPFTFKNFHNVQQLRIIDCGMKDRRRDIHSPANNAVLSYEKIPFLESRVSIFNKIMEALRDDKIELIGVVGIGGVGKTTLVKLIAQQAVECGLFTKQACVDLSWTRYLDKLQKRDISKIQRQILVSLDGELDLYGLNESKRRVELKVRLMKEKTVIILDDIWKEIDLDEIGIPISSCKDDVENECKIVLTCRDEGLLCKATMGGGAQICIRVDALPPEEAWTLFQKTAGPENIPEEVRSIANQVVEECCEGVPLAIVTIAKTLKDYETDQLSAWKNALGQLIKNCAAAFHEGCMPNKVFSCLEWCYCYTTHCLKKKDGHHHHHHHHHVKYSFLLLCSMLFGHDDISMYQLLQYVVGLDLFDGIDSLEQARNRLLELVEILQSSSWLIELDHPPVEDRHHFIDDEDSNLLMGAGNNFVRMHHVVRDVAREIASKDPHPFLVLGEDVNYVGLEEWSKTDESKRCAFISLHCNNDNNEVHDQLPQGLVCPALQFFLLHSNNLSPSLNLSIPNAFFQGMKKLRVLDLSRMDFTTLPSSIDSLANLRTLRLDRCANLVDIAHIGKLTNLQVLSLAHSRIQRLPEEMGQLSNLRLLDLTHCWQLEAIPRNVLSSLSSLECLFMKYSFTKWAAAAGEGEGEGDHQSINANNACFSELNHLSCLTTLYLTIPNAKLLQKVDILFENLKRYSISMGRWRGLRSYRTLRLENIQLGSRDNGIGKLLERSEEVNLTRLKGTNYVLLHPSDEKSELKYLHVRESPEIQYIIDSMDQRYLQRCAFPMLESLVLFKLDKLQQVWHGPIPIGSFRNLRTLTVYLCPKLRHLFLLSTARGLCQLRNMRIEDCKVMRQIIAYERESEDENGGLANLELFPNLRTLNLETLPELVNFTSAFETSSTCSSTNARPANSFSRHMVSFPKLEELLLRDLPKLKDIWYPQHPIGSFSNLRSLTVDGCPRLLNPVPSL